MPPAATIASYALDGISFFSTGKSVSDHAISAVVEKDCALWRVVKGDLICREYQQGERGLMVAFAETLAEGGTASGLGDMYFDEPSDVGAPEFDVIAPAGAEALLTSLGFGTAKPPVIPAKQNAEKPDRLGPADRQALDKMLARLAFDPADMADRYIRAGKRLG